VQSSHRLHPKKLVAMCWNSPKKVAFLDTDKNEFITMEKKEAEMLPHIVTFDLPRFASKTDICEKNPKDKDEDRFLATLHLWRLGVNYNVKRWLGPSSKIIVKKGSCARARNPFDDPID